MWTYYHLVVKLPIGRGGRNIQYKVFKNLLVQWMVILMYPYLIKDMKVGWADWIWLTTGYKPYHYDMVKARNHFIVTYTYIIYIYKVFKHLPMQWMVICRPPYFIKAMDWDGWIWVTNGYNPYHYDWDLLSPSYTWLAHSIHIKRCLAYFICRGWS